MRYVLLEQKDEIDKIMHNIRNNDSWKLVKEGWKYLEFEKKSIGVIKIRVEKKRFENFNINKIDWKITITDIEEFAHSTFIYYIGSRNKCLEKIEELREEYKDNIEVKEWKA